MNPSNPQGVCFGITSAFTKAYLQAEEKQFVETLHQAALHSDDTLIQTIRSFQSNPDYAHNFYSILNHTDPALALEIANPLDFNQVFTQESLRDFLENIPDFPQESRSIFLVKSTTHAVAIIPQNNGYWALFDPSNTRSDSVENFKDAATLSVRLYSSLYGKHEERGNQLALNFCFLHRNRPEYLASVDVRQIKNQITLRPGMNNKAIGDICNLCVESDDNFTLSRVGERLGPKALETLSAGVQVAGHYREHPKKTQAEILAYCAKRPWDDFDNIAADLNCSVVDILKYKDEIRTMWRNTYMTQ